MRLVIPAAFTASLNIDLEARYKNSMRSKFYIASLLLACSLSAQATLYTETYGGGAAAIPDNNTIGLGETITLSGLADTYITSVILHFTLVNGFASDLTTAYLRLGNLTGSPSINLVGNFSGSLSSPVTFDVDVSSTFASLDPNNTWTLFFADTSPGGQTTLNGWSLDITAVPEPVKIALPIFGGLLLTTSLVRRFVSQRQASVV
jgi:hypothetical protein